MNDEEIVLDTSKYNFDQLGRARALVAIAKAQAAGQKVQMRTLKNGDWQDGYHACDEWSFDYRVKPAEPVVTKKTVWTLAVPGVKKVASGGGPDYNTRHEALDSARKFTGGAILSEVVITFRDGVEVSREFRNNAGGPAL